MSRLSVESLHRCHSNRGTEYSCSYAAWSPHDVSHFIFFPVLVLTLHPLFACRRCSLSLPPLPSSSFSSSPVDGRVQLPFTNSFSIFWEALKSAVPVPITAPGGPPQPGEVVKLPNGARIFGLFDDAYFRRPCYPRLIERILRHFAAALPSHQVLVLGCPGAGKSLLATELLRTFQQRGQTVVYENQQLRKRWLLPPHGRIFAGQMDTFSDELGQRATVYICDCGPGEYRFPAVCRATTIVLSWPDKRHYSGWIRYDRVILTLYLPLWSIEEIRAAVPAVHPHRLTAQIDGAGNPLLDANGQPLLVATHEQRFLFFGGSARHVFSDWEEKGLLCYLDRCIYLCDLVALLRTASAARYPLAPADESTWALVRIDVAEDDEQRQPSYERPALAFTSDHVLRALVRRRTAANERQLTELLFDYDRYYVPEEAEGLRVKLFEQFAVNQLTGGGLFRARWLTGAAHADMWVRFPPLAATAMGGPLHQLQAGGPLRARVHVVQMALTAAAPVDLLALHSAMQQLDMLDAPGLSSSFPRPFVLFYFAVTPAVFPSFPSPTAVASGSHIALPDNVHFLALEIPPPGTASRKRKRGRPAVIYSEALLPPPPPSASPALAIRTRQDARRSLCMASADVVRI